MIGLMLNLKAMINRRWQRPRRSSDERKVTDPNGTYLRNPFVVSPDRPERSRRNHEWIGPIGALFCRKVTVHPSFGWLRTVEIRAQGER